MRNCGIAAFRDLRPYASRRDDTGKWTDAIFKAERTRGYARRNEATAIKLDDTRVFRPRCERLSSGFEGTENNEVPFPTELQRYPRLKRHALQLSGRCFILRALSRFIQSAAARRSYSRCRYRLSAGFMTSQRNRVISEHLYKITMRYIMLDLGRRIKQRGWARNESPCDALTATF